MSAHVQAVESPKVIEPLAVDAAALLRACADEAKRSGYARATLVFADRLPNSPGFGVEEARAALLAAGFELDESTWLPKPGLAKHMGVAHSIL